MLKTLVVAVREQSFHKLAQSKGWKREKKGMTKNGKERVFKIETKRYIARKIEFTLKLKFKYNAFRYGETQIGRNESYKSLDI